MAESLKRIAWSRDKETQDRINYYMFQKAKSILTEGTASPAQLAMSQRIYNQTVNLFAACMICATNPTIGAAIDAGNAVTKTDIEYVVVTDQWENMADAEV